MRRALSPSLGFAALLLSGPAFAQSGIEGRWEGRYTCNNTGPATLVLTIQSIGDGGLVAQSEFRPDAARASGVFELSGVFNPSTASFELRPRNWIRPLDGYLRVSYRGRLDPDGQHVTAGIGYAGCSAAALVRGAGQNQLGHPSSPPALTAPQGLPVRRQVPGLQDVSRSPAITPAENAALPAIVGEWEGQAICNRLQSDLVLKIQPFTSGEFRAILETYGQDALLRPVPHFELLARREGDTTYRFVPARGGGMSFSAVLDRTGVLSAASDSCGAFTLRQVTPHSSGRIPSTSASAAGPGYNPVDRLETRCEALIQWASRVNREYPAVDMLRTPGRNAKGVLLFADDDFIPAFGFPYDVAVSEAIALLPAPRGAPATLTGPGGVAPRTLHSAWKDMFSECPRNPFIRAKSHWLWASSLPIRLWIEPHSYYGGDFAISAIVRTIRQIRAVRNELRFVMARKENGGPFAERAKELISIRVSLSGKAELLWPSELAGARDTLARSLTEAAAAEGERVLREVLAATDPEAGLKLISAALAADPQSFLALLDDARRVELRRKLEQKQSEYSIRVARHFLDQAKTAEPTLDGARRLARLIGEGDAASSGFAGQDRQRFRAELEQRRDEILSEIVSGELAALRAFPPGANGLEAGARWMEGFSERFSDFTTNAPVLQGKAAFVQNRSARLAAAVPEAEATLGKINRGGAGAQDESNQVLRRYLSWSGDARLPESLEYDLLAQRFGIVDQRK